MMETMILSHVGMRLRMKKIKKKGGTKKKNEKMRKKREGTVLLPLFPHLCFKVAPCFSYRESRVLSLSYASGNFSF